MLVRGYNQSNDLLPARTGTVLQEVAVTVAGGGSETVALPLPVWAEELPYGRLGLTVSSSAPFTVSLKDTAGSSWWAMTVSDAPYRMSALVGMFPTEAQVTVTNPNGGGITVTLWAGWH